MESIVSYFANVGIDFVSFLKLAGILLLSAVLISAVSRFIFRKQTLLSSSISSSIAIVFIYVAMVLILTVASDLHFLVTPLPLVSITAEQIEFFRFADASFPAVADQLLAMIILAFLVNLVDAWLPKGKNIFSWTWWRLLTVAIGFMLHYGANLLIHKYLPDGIIQYAPMILLIILVAMLLTGALRFVLGLILATVNPLIAALYTFFFATLIGKQITKAVLTAGLLSGVILLMQKMGITSLSLMPEALVAYIPFLLVLIPVWYLISKF